MWKEEREERSRGHMVVEQGCEGSDSKKEGCAFIRCVKMGLRQTRQYTRT